MARADIDLAAQIGRHTVAAELTLPFAGQGNVGRVGDVLEAKRQEDVVGGNVAGADIDAADTVFRRTDRDAHRPGVRALLAETERRAAGARSAQAEIYVLKIPFVAALLVVDDKHAVLQADLVEVLSVETGEAETVEPVEAGEQTV